MPARFTLADLNAWRRDGAVIIKDFFTPQEVAAVSADFEVISGRAGADEPMVKRQDGETGRFHPAQFSGIQVIPIDCSPALNLIGLHPELMRFAKEALGTDELYLYQCQAWAKFTGDADYDQPLHCDFPNHTLTGPSDEAEHNAVTFICLFSDVTEAHGPTHYVVRPDSLKIAGPEATLSDDPTLQDKLNAFERSAAAPAGSLFVYGIDIWHRGTNLTAPGGHRFVMTVCYRAAANRSIAHTAWQFHHRKPWRNVIEHATPEQLACFGVQRPGDPYWTEVTVARAQARYPGWDLTPYREAIAKESIPTSRSPGPTPASRGSATDL